MTLSLTPQFQKRRRRLHAGFTLVELLVTMSMMAIVTGIIFGYSRGNENQNNLNRAEERLVFELGRARTFAINNSVNPNDTTSGKWIEWGIQILNDNSYQIVSRTCPSNTDIKSPKDSCHTQAPVPFESAIFLPKGLTLSATSSSGSSENSIYFLAPEPTVYKESPTDSLTGDSFINFQLKNSTTTKTVTVNSFGQINRLNQ